MLQIAHAWPKLHDLAVMRSAPACSPSTQLFESMSQVLAEEMSLDLVDSNVATTAPPRKRGNPNMLTTLSILSRR